MGATDVMLDAATMSYGPQPLQAPGFAHHERAGVVKRWLKLMLYRFWFVHKTRNVGVGTREIGEVNLAEAMEIVTTFEAPFSSLGKVFAAGVCFPSLPRVLLRSHRQQSADLGRDAAHELLRHRVCCGTFWRVRGFLVRPPENYARVQLSDLRSLEVFRILCRCVLYMTATLPPQPRTI